MLFVRIKAKFAELSNYVRIIFSWPVQQRYSTLRRSTYFILSIGELETVRHFSGEVFGFETEYCACILVLQLLWQFRQYSECVCSLA